MQNYYSFSDYVKKKFGFKVGKISINTDFGCDHKANNGGCRFCNLNSYKPPYAKEDDIKNQWLNGVNNYKNRYKKYYAYFQLGTPLSQSASGKSLKYAKKLIEFEDCVGLMFGARSDMLEEAVLLELNNLSKKHNKEIWLEMGLQSSNDDTSVFINRGHNFNSFAQIVENIKNNYKNLIISTHIIFGLPKGIEGKKIILETKYEMLQTVRDVSNLKIDSIKFHQLDIVSGSYFEKMYKDYDFYTLDENFYIELMADAIAIVREDIIISRLMGDSLGESLIAPKWNKSKGEIINSINKLMTDRKLKQGCKFISL